MSELLFYLIGGALASVAGAAGIGFALRPYLRQSDAARRAIFSRVAGDLGLDATVRGCSGTAEGVAISAEWEEKARADVGRGPATSVHASFLVALDLGIDLHSRARAASGLEAVVEGATAIRARDPELDEAFDIAGSPERVLRLLTRELRAELLDASRKAFVMLDDRGVSFTLRGDLSEEELRWAVSHAIQVVRLVDTVRRAVPPRADFAPLVAGFERAARQLGASFSETPFLLEGVACGAAVRAVPEQIRWGLMGAAVTVGFPGSLGAALSVRMRAHGASSADDAKPRALSLEDETFEAAFSVTAEDEAHSKHVLSAPIRDSLVRLSTGATDLRVDDETLLYLGPVDAGAFPETIEALASLAEAIWERGGKRGALGPYR